MIDWSLKNRTDEETRTRMYFEVKRKGASKFDGQLWVTLELRGGGWQLVSYTCYY